MEIESNGSPVSGSWNQRSENAPVGSMPLEDGNGAATACYSEVGRDDFDTTGDLAIDRQRQGPALERQHRAASPSATFADFVEIKFIPEFVATKRYAGRAHFQAILKYVLPPERAARAFGANRARTWNTLTAIAGWPYIDRLRFPEITADVIHGLTTAALARGYSIQTATHIRNVVRSIFAHAIRTGFFEGENPASMVTLPPLARRQTTSLTLGELKALMQAMRYPEREIALFAMLTDMNVAEICGLQWRYINMSRIGQMIGQEFIPARYLAVRYQSYRGELSSVAGKRRRFTRIPDLLSSILHELKGMNRTILPEDFVLVSRNGAPIRPENILARRLKPIRLSFSLPWLSWSVFNQTAATLRSQIGTAFEDELRSSLFQASHAAPMNSIQRKASL